MHTEDFLAAAAAAYGIIDFHVHPYRIPVHNICQYKTALPFTEEDCTVDLRRCGFARYAGSMIDTERKAADFCEDFAYTRELNDLVMEMAEKDPALIPGIHVHPAFPEESAEEIKRAHARGVRLIGELVPGTMGWSDYADPALYDVWELAGQLQMTVSFHSNWDNEAIEKMIRSHPNVTFVAAHPGDKGGFLSHVGRMKKYENAYLDLSGTGIFRYGLLEYGVRTVGSERFLFGTDYPVCNPGVYVGGVLYERLTEKDRENIFRNNAVRLLGL